MSFPTQRPRRLRGNPTLRRLAREARIAPQDLVYPLFVRDAIEEPQPIESMPGQVQHTLESLTREAEAALKLGVRSLVLFGIPGGKDPQGSGAWIDDGIVQRALRQLRDAFGSDALLIADLCLCEYTDHGHCGVLDGERVDNDRTLEIYQRIATSQAAAGADVVMVKPALAFLDVIRAVAESTEVPVAAYNVSGEYAMVKAAALRGWIDERRVLREILLGIRRAGAQMILTYHAREVAADIPCWDEMG